MGAAQRGKAGASGVRTVTFRDGGVSAVGRQADGKKTGVWKCCFRTLAHFAGARFAASPARRHPWASLSHPASSPV